MANGNTVQIVGNLTRDCELRFTAQGLAVASFGVAHNFRRQTANGEWEEETSFFDVTAWRELAENCAETLTKGSRVVVTGRLRQHGWEDAEGNKRSKVEIVAEEVAPSLRWATATVTRNERTERSDNGGGQAPARQAPARQPAQAAARAPSRSGYQAGDGPWDSEEPF